MERIQKLILLNYKYGLFPETLSIQTTVLGPGFSVSDHFALQNENTYGRIATAVDPAGRPLSFRPKPFVS